MTTAVQYASAAFALLAGILWLISACIRIPPITLTRGRVQEGTFLVTGRPPHEMAFNRISAWSAAAAFCTGIAALLEAVATYLST